MSVWYSSPWHSPGVSSRGLLRWPPSQWTVSHCTPAWSASTKSSYTSLHSPSSPEIIQINTFWYYIIVTNNTLLCNYHHFYLLWTTVWYKTLRPIKAVRNTLGNHFLQCHWISINYEASSALQSIFAVYNAPSQFKYLRMTPAPSGTIVFAVYDAKSILTYPLLSQTPMHKENNPPLNRAAQQGTQTFQDLRLFRYQLNTRGCRRSPQTYDFSPSDLQLLLQSLAITSLLHADFIHD